MTRYSAEDLQSGAVSFFGAFAFDRRPEGISPRRLPDWTRPQLPPTMDVMVRMPSGVRMAFVTDATTLALHVQTTRMVMPPREPRPVVFDLTIDDDTVHTSASDGGNSIVVDPRNPADFKLVRGDAYTVEFADLGPGRKRCEIWLPHNAFVELRSLELPAGASLEPAPAPREKRWLHYGSSISHCMEATQPTGTWPAVAARLSGMHLVSLGFGGQCHLDQFVARTMRAADADVITIKTGINVINMDSMRERVFMPALHGFLDTIRETRPETPIVVASPIYCPSAESRPGPTVANAEGKFVTVAGHEAIQLGCMTLRRVREIIQEVTEARRALGDRHLHYVDGLELFSAADAPDLPDDLHPNPAGYARMGERFAKRVFSRDGLGLARQ